MEISEYLEILNSGVEMWNDWRKKNEKIKPYLPHVNLSHSNLSHFNLEDVNLTGANLTGANLADAKLTRAILIGTNLTGANLMRGRLLLTRLIGSNLTESNLSFADLFKANLTGANLTDADLTETDLTDTDLTDVNLTGVDLIKAKLVRAGLVRVDLSRFNLTGVNLTGANLTGTDLTGIDLTSTKLTGVDLTGANLTGVDLIGVDLTGARLTKANLTGVDLTRTQLVNSDLREADLTDVDLNGGNLTGADLTRTYLAGTKLVGVNLTDAILTGAKLVGVNLTDAKLTRTNLVGVNLTDADLTDADLTDADLTDADLTNAKLYGAKLYGAKLYGAKLLRAKLLGVDLTGIKLAEDHNEGHNYMMADLSNIHFNSIYLNKSKEIDDILSFDSIYPFPFQLKTWQTILVYVYFNHAIEKVLVDFEHRKQNLSGNYGGSTATSQQKIPRDSLLTIVPKIPFVVCNPPSLQFRMTEDYHYLQFRAMYEPTILVERLIKGRINGTIQIYLEALLIGEIPVESYWEAINANLSIQTGRVGSNTNQLEFNTNFDNYRRQTAHQFRKIFVSYSHKDLLIVERLEKVYRVLGDDYWRDFQSLRSGENWSIAIEQAIKDCNVFQLCWSNNAKSSKFVKREWKTALQRDLEGFIRPLYWEDPLPSPPKELSHLHFAHFPL